MQQNIPLAVAIQTVGSFCFAMAAHLQDKAVVGEVHANKEKSSLTAKDLIASMKNPRWVLGLILMGVSLACQITALFFAPVSVVQPVGLLALPWSMIIQARAEHHKIPKRMITAMCITVLATFGFTAIVSANTGHEADLATWAVFLGALVVYVAAGTFGRLGAVGPKRWRSLFWASGGAMFYGLEAALVRALIQYADQHEWASDPLFWLIVACLLAGSVAAGWMVQQGYATGAAELVVASMTITSPVVAVLFGILVLGEGSHHTSVVTAFIMVLALIAIGGVIVISWLHYVLIEHSSRYLKESHKDGVSHEDASAQSRAHREAEATAAALRSAARRRAEYLRKTQGTR
ncbi:MAG: EamA/RhaT family transporter [Actinomycetaceae bacterium]|nr:EamA/RhaT family transporter [Arcanobacterium sp.]MDD7687435.1 EamA/RhaT family transporter [Actinomycetaceae bacterium]MDY5272909.1 EamA/RhaT family transporter [Arcanobacterium sp.]